MSDLTWDWDSRVPVVAREGETLVLEIKPRPGEQVEVSRVALGVIGQADLTFRRGNGARLLISATPIANPSEEKE